SSQSLLFALRGLVQPVPGVLPTTINRKRKKPPDGGFFLLIPANPRANNGNFSLKAIRSRSNSALQTPVVQNLQKLPSA
ncbi:hypothetical protein, partial [Bacillus pumilus]|uniref:hypothetical protein n=1 Tax=Bacillus pumilus TaxID=1408 RepID=UPI001C92BDCF